MAGGEGLVVCALARESAKLAAVAARHPLVTMGPGEHFAGAFSCHIVSLEPKPAWALLAGYSGSLSPSVAPGDLVVATEVQELKGSRFTPTLEIPDLSRSDCAIHHGPICTSPTLVATAMDKKSLGRQTGALAVDMESAAFASTCKRFDIPWAVVRVVFDSVEDPLHPKMLRWCDRQGRDNMAPLAWDLVTSPGWWWHLPGWAKRDILAGKSLAQAVGSFIQSKSPNRAS